jgi:sugar phosphate isomerase/epimerase
LNWLKDFVDIDMPAHELGDLPTMAGLEVEGISHVGEDGQRVDLRQFRDRVSHVHIKDVSESLAAAARGDLTGIAVSHCAIGEGVNADNIRQCVDLLVEIGFDGVLSIECEGQGGPMIEQSLAWVRKLVDAANARMG